MPTVNGIPGLNSPELTDTVLSNYAEGKGPFTPSDSARALSVFRTVVDRLGRAEARLYDMCLGDDGQAFSEAERYLAEHRPDLKERIDEHDGRKLFPRSAAESPERVEPTCKTCVFSLLGTQGDPDEGLCRRHPPQMVPVPGDDTVGPLWAEVTADDWCGEYKGAASGKEEGA